MDKLKGILVERGYMGVFETDYTLENLQELVEGDIEIAHNKDFVIVCNEDGLSKGFPLNRLGLWGKAFVLKLNYDTGNLVSLSEDEIEAAQEEIKRNAFMN